MTLTRLDAASQAIAAASRRGLLAGLSIGLITLLTATRGGEDALAVKKRRKRPGPPSPRRKQGACTVLLPEGSAGAGGACQGRRYPHGHNPDASTSLLCWTSDDEERHIAT